MSATKNRMLEIFPNLDQAWADREIKEGRIYLLDDGELTFSPNVSLCFSDPPNPEATRSELLAMRTSYRRGREAELLEKANLGPEYLQKGAHI